MEGSQIKQKTADTFEGIPMPQTFRMSMNVREQKPNYGQIVPFKGCDEDYWWRENKLADMADIYSSYLNAEQRFCLILTTVNRL